MKKLIFYLILGFLGWQIYSHYASHQPTIAQTPSYSGTSQTPLVNPTFQWPNDNNPATNFRCDGRVYCSQMTSCAEATFFLRNCPNVKMDGNNDGIPCERQWCHR